MELNKLKLSTKSNNFIIWALVAVIVLGFGKSSSTLGFNFFNAPGNKPYGNQKKYAGGKNCAVAVPNTPVLGPVANGFGGFLGGNGIFLLAIVALLFLCKDDKKKGNKDMHEAEFCEEN